MVDGPMGKMLSAKLADKGVVVLGFFDLGFRNVTNSKRPITKAEDLEGLKLRVIPNPVFLETFKTFKANPRADALRRALRRARKQGRGRPGEPVLGDPVEQVLRSAEVRQRHQPRVRDQPRPDQQALLGQAVGRQSTSCCRTPPSRPRTSSARSAARPQARPWPNCKAKGMVYNDIAPAELARMRAEVKPVYDKFAASYDPAAVSLFKEVERGWRACGRASRSGDGVCWARPRWPCGGTWRPSDAPGVRALAFPRALSRAPGHPGLPACFALGQRRGRRGLLRDVRAGGLRRPGSARLPGAAECADALVHPADAAPPQHGAQPVPRARERGAAHGQPCADLPVLVRQRARTLASSGDRATG